MFADALKILDADRKLDFEINAIYDVTDGAVDLWRIELVRGVCWLGKFALDLDIVSDHTPVVETWIGAQYESEICEAIRQRIDQNNEAGLARE